MKRIAALFLALLMIVMLAACGSGSKSKGDPRTSAKPAGPVYGDADGDGKLTILDATRIQRHLAGLTPQVAPDQMKYAMVSGGSTLSILDATMIQQRLVNLIKIFPVEDPSFTPATTGSEPSEAEGTELSEPTLAQSGELKMMIGSTPVTVEWEDSDSVAALKEVVGDEPLVIEMKMYEDFEQIGQIGDGSVLPNDNETIDAVAGDVLLFEGNHLVVFYGDNTWEYTRLGRIIDKTPDELAELLSDGNVTVTLTME